MENYKLALYVSLALVFLAFASTLTFYYSPPENTVEAFFESMRQCETGVSFINEEPAASWRYKIKRLEGSDCVIEVTMLQPKVGDLSMEALAGYSMECAYPRGVSAYPERTLDSCHGRLKEELQTIVIGKLQTYVFDNLKGINKGLEEP